MTSNAIRQKLNTTPISTSSETSNRRVQRKQRKEEAKYQHFVHDLHKEIDLYMNQYLRENRFDTRAHQSSDTDSTLRTLQTTLKSRTINSHRTHESNTIITSISNRQDPLSLLKHNETKRLAADVQTILTGPAMKTFYSQFIRPKQRSNPIVEFI